LRDYIFSLISVTGSRKNQGREGKIRESMRRNSGEMGRVKRDERVIREMEKDQGRDGKMREGGCLPQRGDGDMKGQEGIEEAIRRGGR
jgi:hypothetical protein